MVRYYLVLSVNGVFLASCLCSNRARLEYNRHSGYSFEWSFTWASDCLNRTARNIVLPLFNDYGSDCRIEFQSHVY